MNRTLLGPTIETLKNSPGRPTGQQPQSNLRQQYFSQGVRLQAGNVIPTIESDRLPLWVGAQAFEEVEERTSFDTGHFALETYGEEIASRIERFFGHADQTAF